MRVRVRVRRIRVREAWSTKRPVRKGYSTICLEAFWRREPRCCREERADDLNYLVFDCGMSVVLLKNDDDDDDDDD